MYGAGDYDLAGFSVGCVERSRLLDGIRIKAGHRLLGMASSGPHSNGYSLIRKVLEQSGAELDDPLTNPDGSVVALGDALLAPTTIYVKPILKMLETGEIDGLAHITGGGLTENIIRAIPNECGIVINTGSWAKPAVFDWLQSNGNIADSEMLRTFNCGIGMVMIASESAASGLIAASMAAGIACQDIGAVVEKRQDAARVEYSRT
jgi:phosphoribosylformylglycinamidine cyclo-ligase